MAVAQKNKMSALIERAAKELENTKTSEARLQELIAKKEQLLKELELIDEEIKKLS